MCKMELMTQESYAERILSLNCKITLYFFLFLFALLVSTWMWTLSMGRVKIWGMMELGEEGIEKALIFRDEVYFIHPMLFTAN